MKIKHHNNSMVHIHLTLPEYVALRSFLLTDSVSSLFRDSAESALRAESIYSILESFANSKG